MHSTTQTGTPPARLPPERNLSHVDPALPPATVACVFRHYFASLFIYGLLLVLLKQNPWFRDLLQMQLGRFFAWDLYLGYYLAYAAISPVVFLVLRPRSLWNSKNVLILSWLARLLRHLGHHGFTAGDGGWRPTFKEKHAFVFLLIKLFYGPLMLNSFLGECAPGPALVLQFQQSSTWISRLDCLYSASIVLVFLLDSALFCFGYHTEAGFLRNEVRYVETTLSGILVCIICYPPFNNVSSAFLGPSNDEVNILYGSGLHHPLTWILRGLAVLFLLLLTAASFSLFTKASNLTNRGIVQYGPYRWVRHPGYVGKNLFWLMTLLPTFLAVDFSNPMFSWTDHLLFCLGRACGFAAWCSIYILRALTEERLLMQDPDYVAYCRKVRYRFIPGVI